MTNGTRCRSEAIPFDRPFPPMLRSDRMMSSVFQPATAENLPEAQISILSFLRDIGPIGKVVLGILLLFSFISWVIIFAKFLRLRAIDRQSEKFIQFFRKSKRFSEVNTIASQLTETPLSTLFRAGYAELDAQVKANRPEDPAVTAGGVPTGKLLIKNIAGVERALERAIGVEVSRLTKNMTFLATTASASPSSVSSARSGESCGPSRPSAPPAPLRSWPSPRASPRPS